MIPTDFSQLIGNDSVKTYLTHMVHKNKVGHSLLFAGPDGIGKSLFAQVLASTLMSTENGKDKHRQKIERGHHPDIHIYRPEGKIGMHSIHSLRQLSEEVNLPPYESQWKVFIIHEADRMLTYSANALLKTFEEPPPQTLIVLLSHAPHALLPTIVSRCRSLHFQAIPHAEIKSYLQRRYALDELIAGQIASRAQGSLARAIRLAEQGEDETRHIVLSVLAQGALPTYKALTEVVQSLTEKIEAIKKQAEDIAKGELYKDSSDYLSAHQQNQLEKELEGAVAISYLNEAHLILDLILSWHRDLHLLQVGGNKEYLINQDYSHALEQSLQRGETLPLDQVQKAIDEAKVSLQRSTATHVCLENLFLKLNLI